MSSDIAVAAHRIHDPANTLAVLVSRLLARIATQCADVDIVTNCAACPVSEAARELAAHINGGQP